MDINSADRSTDDIRQGETGHGVRYMLGFGTAFAVIAMAIVIMLAI